VTERHVGAQDFFIRLRKLENANLKLRDIFVLYTIGRNPGIMGQELSKKLGYASRSSVQDCISRLLRFGYVEDRRREVSQLVPNDLHILPRGEALITEVVPN